MVPLGPDIKCLLLHSWTFTQQNEHCDWLILGHVPLIKFKCISTTIQQRSTRSLKIECKSLNSLRDSGNRGCSEGNTGNIGEVFVSQVFSEHWLLPLKKINLQNYPLFQFVCLSLVWVMTSLARFAIAQLLPARRLCNFFFLLYESLNI